MPEFEEPVFFDTLFHRKRKHGKWDIVEEPQLEGLVADTHVHLQLLRDPALILARCAAHGVGFLCTITDVYEDGLTPYDQLDAWKREAERNVAKLVSQDGEDEYPSVPQVRIAAGCHPHNAKYYDDALEATLRERLADPRTAAVGEIGLDFHYDFSPRADQRTAFRCQLRLAKECGLPVILHVREAHDEALAIMYDEGFPEAGTLLHCFNLDWNVLEPWVEAGCYVAFGGPLTFKKSEEVREAAARVPLNRLLTETDAPYMTPEPLRGTTCGPEHVIFTAERLAEVRGCAPGDERAVLLRQLFENAHALLNREPTAWQKQAAHSFCANSRACGANVAATPAGAAAPAACEE